MPDDDIMFDFTAHQHRSEKLDFLQRKFQSIVAILLTACLPHLGLQLFLIFQEHEAAALRHSIQQ